MSLFISGFICFMAGYLLHWWETRRYREEILKRVEDLRAYIASIRKELK